MTCFHQIRAWQRNQMPLDPKELMYGFKYFRKLKFKEPAEHIKHLYRELALPCGKCQGCRIDRANEWATRVWAETKLWERNCFITLTYDEKHLPKNRSLNKKDLQDFWKRLRYHETGYEEWENPITEKIQKPIRYFVCGEYGPKTHRPHYHAAIFNWEPDDLKLYKVNHQGDELYISEKLTEIWGKGFVIVGKLTYESACYISRYVSKKIYKDENENITADQVENWYKDREKEFIETSRNGGIGIVYWNKEKDKIIRNNGIFIKIKDNVKLKKIPRFFKKKWKEKEETVYIYWSYEQQQKAIKAWQETLAKTDLSEKDYVKMLKNKLYEKLRLLRRDNLI